MFFSLISQANSVQQQDLTDSVAQANDASTNNSSEAIAAEPSVPASAVVAKAEKMAVDEAESAVAEPESTSDVQEDALAVETAPDTNEQVDAADQINDAEVREEASQAIAADEPPSQVEEITPSQVEEIEEIPQPAEASVAEILSNNVDIEQGVNDADIPAPVGVADLADLPVAVDEIPVAAVPIEQPQEETIRAPLDIFEAPTAAVFEPEPLPSEPLLAETNNKNGNIAADIENTPVEQQTVHVDNSSTSKLDIVAGKRLNSLAIMTQCPAHMLHQCHD